MRMYSGYASHTGNSRGINQDAVFLDCIEKKGQYFALGAVCDGIGGMERGELASSMIVGEIREWFKKVNTWLDINTTNPAVLFAHLKDAAEIWNEKICEFRDREDIRMGTTMSLILILRDTYYIVHVGDSRIYRYHEEGLEQLTMDACVARPTSGGRFKNYLDNFMGRSRELWFQSLEGRVHPGDLFLFCTDGLYHHLSQRDLEEIYRENHKKQELCDSCVRLADTMIARGETDNISLGIFHFTEKKGWF